MSKNKTKNKSYFDFYINKPFAVIAISVLAIASFGTYMLNSSDAAKPNTPATGSITATNNGDLSTPYSVSFNYSKSAKQLKRPFIQFECYRDVDGDGKINNIPFTNSADLVYAHQVYLLDSWQHPDYPVTVTSSGSGGLSGASSANLLSGSSKLVSDKGASQCSASLQEWGTNLRQETYPIIYATTPLVTLQDPRL